MKRGDLKCITAGPNPTLIRHLEELLEDAKRGELQAMVYVSSWRGNQVNSGWTTGVQPNRMRLIGELEQVKFHLMAGEL